MREIPQAKKKKDYDGKGFTTVQKSQGTDRLLRPGGGRGFSESVVYQKFPPQKNNYQWKLYPLLAIYSNFKNTPSPSNPV